jgi:Spy/CpxP family protein refolding chaperone
MVFALVVSLVLVDSLLAQQGGRGAGRRGGFSPIDRVERVKGLNLTDDQKSKLADLKKVYDPQLKELAAKLDGVLTADQKKARDEAMKAAREAHKRGPEVRDSIQAAMKLTDAQKTELAKDRKAIGALDKEISGKITALLTAEQQDVLKKARADHAGHGHGGHGQHTESKTT